MNLIGRCPPSSDMLNWYSIFERGDYKPVVDLFPDKQAPLRIMDCGAYVGYSSVYFSEQFPNATILAVEPDAENYSMLDRNTSGHYNVILSHGAIWSKPCVLNIFRDFRDKKEWSYYCKEVDGIGILGHTILDRMKLMSWKYIDILKMDIEGGEFEVFKDTNFLEFCKVVCMEIHHEKGNPHDIFEAFKKHNFQVQQAGEIIIATRGKV
jgi:FkbM family methyltransferase